VRGVRVRGVLVREAVVRGVLARVRGAFFAGAASGSGAGAVPWFDAAVTSAPGARSAPGVASAPGAGSVAGADPAPGPVVAEGAGLPVASCPAALARDCRGRAAAARGRVVFLAGALTGVSAGAGAEPAGSGVGVVSSVT
jgi:hypothetical protein